MRFLYSFHALFVLYCVELDNKLSYSYTSYLRIGTSFVLEFIGTF